jgi:hypothetical protein
MEINDLPDELLLKIFFSVPLNSLIDVFYLTLTCKKWRRILWSKEFLQEISSFKYQSRFLIYRCLLNNNNNSKQKFLEYDHDSTIPHITIDGNSSSLKQDIQNCPLINTTISLWCRTLNHTSLSVSTVFLLWHFHLGYIGFYRHSPNEGNALIKCTYTQQHQLKTTFFMELGEWYHIAIVIKENINKENLFVAPYSSVWFASHCGANKWHGSLFDVCLWKRCLEPYEIKEMARTRISIEKINFISNLNKY